MTPSPTDTSAEGSPLGGLPLASGKSVAWWMVVVAVVLEALATALDVGLGPWSVVGFEEGRNARAALQLACGHGDKLLDLQYRDFCGGCTGVAVLGAPLLWVFGDGVAVWKAVPAAFHLGLVSVVAWAVGRTGGTRPALLAVAAFAATPWALRELSLTAWGNHAEVRTLVLLAAAVLLTRRWAALGSLVAGVLTGLAVWFAHISLFALPGLAYLAVRRGWAGWPALPGLALGLVPLGLFFHQRPTAVAGAEQMWGQVGRAPVDAWLAYLVGPLAPDVLWPTSGHPVLGLVLAGATGLVALGAVVGTLRGVQGRRPLATFAMLSAMGFFGATLLRPDLWADVPAVPGFGAFHIRYRAVLWPLVPLGLGFLAQWTPRWALALGVPFVVAGLGARTVAWTKGPGPGLWSSVWTDPGRPDATVPEGAPPRRNPWAQDRLADIQAAQQFLDSHADRLPACAADHAGELGRRIGLHVRRGHSPRLEQLPEVTAAVVTGVAWGLHAPAGRLPERVPGTLPPAWVGPVEAALHRLEADPERHPGTPGTCLGLADDAWRAATSDGRHAASGPAPEPPPGCSDPGAWKDALGTVSKAHGRCPLAAGWTCPPAAAHP